MTQKCFCSGRMPCTKLDISIAFLMIDRFVIDTVYCLLTTTPLLTTPESSCSYKLLHPEYSALDIVFCQCFVMCKQTTKS